MTLPKILLGVGLVCLSLVGCSDYLDNKLQEEVRQTFKAPDNFKLSEQEVANLKDMGITINIHNEYPVLSVQAKFHTINKAQVPSGFLHTFGQELSTLACSLLDDLSQMDERQRKAIATVITEDKVSTKFVLQDKTGQVMIDEQIPLTQCPQFTQFQSAK